MTDPSSEPGAGDARIELVEYAPEGDEEDASYRIGSFDDEY